LNLVIYPAIDQQRLKQIVDAAKGDLVTNAATESEALAAIADADAFFGKVTPRMLAEARRLRWIQAPTASLEHFMFRELVEHEAVLTNMRGIHAEPIADQVLGYILSFARNLHLYVRRQIEHRWDPVGGEPQRSTFTAGPSSVTDMDRATVDLLSATVGIVGLGSIGMQVSRRARAFGMHVVGIDAKPDTKRQEADRVWGPDGLDLLLDESDFVVISAPHTPDTVGLFGPSQFKRMKRSAYLINVGRGVIVNLDSLTAALRAGEIAGAALDVFETEPLPKDHPLWDMATVIITPHVAGTSPIVAPRHLGVVIDNIRRFRSGEPLLNVVNKEEWF
jgi:phosphoglycerate dehydrogenase-like enzyme